MRSGGGTKVGAPSRVTDSTKRRIDCFARPSFHEGSGSAARAPIEARTMNETNPGWTKARAALQLIGPNPLCTDTPSATGDVSYARRPLTNRGRHERPGRETRARS